MLGPNGVDHNCAKSLLDDRSIGHQGGTRSAVDLPPKADHFGFHSLWPSSSLELAVTGVSSVGCPEKGMDLAR